MHHARHLLALLALAVAPAVASAALVINPVGAPDTPAATLITGSGARANGPVELFVNGVSQGSVQADGDGNWSITADIKADDVLLAEPNQVWNFNTDGDSEGWASPTESYAVAGGLMTITEDNEENINNNGTFFLPGSFIIDPSLPVIEIGYRTIAQPFQGIVLTTTDTGDPENPDPDPFGPQWVPLGGTEGFVADVIDLTKKDLVTLNPDYPAGVTGGVGFGFNGFAFGETFEIDYIRMRETLRFHFPYDNDSMGWGITQFNLPPAFSGGTVDGVADGVMTVSALGEGNLSISPKNNDAGFNGGGPDKQGNLYLNAALFDRFNMNARITSTNSGQAFGMFYGTDWGTFTTLSEFKIYNPTYSGFEKISIDYGSDPNWNPIGARILQWTYVSFMYALAAGEKVEFDYFEFAPSTFTGDSEPVVVSSSSAPQILVINPASAPAGGAPVNVTGSGANPEGWVELFVNGVSQGSVTADLDGNWTISADVAPGDVLTAIPARVWNFNTDANQEGWATFDDVVVENGSLIITGTDADTNITLYLNEANLADPNVQQVLEVRYRLTGSVAPPGVILTNSDQGGPFGPNWTPAANIDWRVDIADLTSPNGGVNPNLGWSGIVNQIGLGFNGTNESDVFEVDYIRLRQTYRYGFNGDGDAQGWVADGNAGNQTTITGISNGLLSAAPVAAGDNVALVAPFGTLNPLVFNQYNVRMIQNSTNPAQIGGFGFFYNGPFNWTADFAPIPAYTPDYGNFIITSLDLSTDPEWNTPAVSPSLSHQFMFAPNDTDNVQIDYVEFAPASVIGEATPVVVGLDGTEPSLGDINNDGVINVADVTALANLLAASTPPSLAVGDVNDDGQVDDLDVEALALQIVD
jgi:hypothetical protein